MSLNILIITCELNGNTAVTQDSLLGRDFGHLVIRISYHENEINYYLNLKELTLSFYAKESSAGYIYIYN